VPDDTPVLVFDMTGDVCPGEPVMMTVPVKFKHCCGAP
jgi:TusA-related sulfurtransferase